jgi:hypothetical protein
MKRASSRARVRNRSAHRTSRFGRIAAAAMVPASLLGLVSPSSCTVTGVVGGDCRDGFGWCDGECLDLQSDEDNCGSCGHECRPGVTCRHGVCGGSRDGSAEGGANAGGQGNYSGEGQGNDKDGGKDAEGDVFDEWDASWDGSHAGAGGVGGEDGTGGRRTDGGNRAGDDSGGNAGSSAAGASHAGGVEGGSPSTGGRAAGGATGSPGGAGARGGNSGAYAGSGNAANAGAGGSECTPPYRTASQCGDCYTACRGTTPLCSPVDGEYQCVPRCEEPLVDCSAQCVDVQSNPDHCGRCGHRCPSRLCQAGTCVGAQAGDVVLICMNLEAIAEPQKFLLGNSVFHQLTAVRILSYEEYASSRATSQVAAAIESFGRPYSLELAASANQVVQDLNVIDFDVLIVHDQPNAPEGALGDIGSAWAETLDSFTRAGGTVLVLSSTDGVDEMHELLTSAGLLEVDAERSVTGTRLANAAPGDAIGDGVLTRFLALAETCAFDTSLVEDAENVVVVTTDPTQAPVDPVVIHRVISPP